MLQKCIGMHWLNSSRLLLEMYISSRPTTSYWRQCDVMWRRIDVSTASFARWVMLIKSLMERRHNLGTFPFLLKTCRSAMLEPPVLPTMDLYPKQLLVARNGAFVWYSNIYHNMLNNNKLHSCSVLCYYKHLKKNIWRLLFEFNLHLLIVCMYMHGVGGLCIYLSF